MCLLRFGQYVDAGRLFVWFLEVDVAGDEAVLHHQCRVDDFAGSGHPHLVSCLALGRGDGHGAFTEELSDGLCFATVSDDGAGGMCIDVSNLLGVHAAVAEAEFKRACRTCHVGCGDVVAVAREAPAYYLCDDVGTALYGVFIAFEDDGCTSAARHESVAAGIEGSAGFLRLVLTDREGLDAVEGCDAVHVVLFCSAAYYAVLQALRYKECCQADALRAGGTGCRSGEVDAAQLEETCQVHGDVGVHALEDGAAAAGHSAVCLTELVEALHGGFCYGVVAVDDAYLMCVEVVFVNAGMVKCLLGCDIAILCLFGHEVTEITGNVGFEVNFGNIAYECRAEACILALLAEDDTTLALIQCIAHFFKACSYAGPYAHACYYYSIHLLFSNLRCSIYSFLFPLVFLSCEGGSGGLYFLTEAAAAFVNHVVEFLPLRQHLHVVFEHRPCLGIAVAFLVEDGD